MISINVDSKIILRATQAPGFACNRGRICYFKKMDGISYRCTLSISDSLESSFLIQERNIYQVVDSLSNQIVYTHDPSDAL
jgi:hypothetical protein